MEWTQPEQDGLWAVAWWSFANAAFGVAFYKIRYGKWVWMDIPQLIEDTLVILRHIKNPPKIEYIEEPKKKRVEHPDDYWDGEVNYETGEVSSNSGPTIRNPKNRDRAYSGSVERFDDGGW